MTVPHYGKREPGLLTAASPGDTLYFNFGSYNDSGNSEALTGLAVTDIEVIKNGAATVRATDSGYSLISDTGQVGDRAGIYRVSISLFNTTDDATFYAIGGWYQAFIDSVTIDGKTVRFWLGSWEIGRDKVNVMEVDSDTGAADHLQKTYASGFADTGVNDTIGRIRSDADTGLRAQISDVDTGLHDVIAEMDTGFRELFSDLDTGLRDFITNVDTGLTNRLSIIGFDVDTGLRAQISDVDTGLHDHINDIDTGLRDHVDNTDTGLRRFIDNLDTGIKQRFNALSEDTGGVNVNAIFGDTGAAHRLSLAFVLGFHDTGLNDHLTRIRGDADTGLRAHMDDSDTGLKDILAELDSGLRDYIDNTDTGLRAFIDDIDTGVRSHIDKTDTGLRAHIDDLDTGLHDTLADYDSGLRDHIDNTDSGLRAFIDDIDTGLRDTISDYDTGMRDLVTNTDTGLTTKVDAIKAKTDSLTFTVAGQVDANIQSVNDVTVTGDGTSGNTWGP